jgi:hypothetical protein
VTLAKAPSAAPMRILRNNVSLACYQWTYSGKGHTMDLAVIAFLHTTAALAAEARPKVGFVATHAHS